MKTTFQKHHFAPWSEDRSGLGGLMRVVLRQEGDAHSHCTRCGVTVVQLRVGGLKFWVAKDNVGKWTSKRPPCEAEESSESA